MSVGLDTKSIFVIVSLAVLSIFKSKKKRTTRRAKVNKKEREKACLELAQDSAMANAVLRKIFLLES